MNVAPILRTQTCALALWSMAMLAGPAHAEFIYARLVPGAGMQPDGASSAVDLSSNGKTVVFSSAAKNWIAGDTYNGDRAVAIDMDTGLVEVVSATLQGEVIRGETPVASGDGRYVAFLTLGGPLGANWQVARKDRQTGALDLVSATATGEAASSGTDDDTVSISADGRYVAFETSAANFGVPSGSWPETFVKDMQTGQVEMASVKADGNPSGGECAIDPHALSDSGRYLTMICGTAMVPGATTGQVYVRDLQANTTELVSRGATAASGSSAFAYRAAISPSGRFVSFQNRGYGGLGYANGVDSTGNSGVYLRDRQTQTTIAIPRPALVPAAEYDNCSTSVVSDIGSVLVTCPLEVGGSWVPQVFLYVPGAGAPDLLSTNALDQPGNQPSGYSLAVKAGGLSMAFESQANNIDPDDTNGFSDIFVLVESSVLTGVIFADGFDG